MARRLIPIYLATAENAGRGAFVSGLFHAVMLGGLIVASPQLFGKTADKAELPITIQIFEGVYLTEEPETAIAAAPVEEAAITATEPAITIVPTEAAATELVKPEAAPEINVPDVRAAAIEQAARAVRPADSGPIPEPKEAGDVAMVYERGAPLTPRQEVGDASAPAKLRAGQPKADPLPEGERALAAEIRRLKALEAQTQVQKRLAAARQDAQSAADAAARLEALKQRLQRLNVARAAARVPKAEPSKDADAAERALADARRARLKTAAAEKAVTQKAPARDKPVADASELPKPPLPKLSAADILKQSERRSADQETLSAADKERARQAIKRYQAARKQGSKAAEINLAKALDKGKGIKKDRKKATKILERLARQNYQPAQIELAKKLLTGDGVKQDRKRAYVLLKTASDENNVVARRALKALDRDLSDQDRKLAEAEAKKWRRHISKQRAARKISSVQQRELDNDLRVAVDSGNVQRIESLLRSGADPNAIDASGRDAIIAAAWRGRDIVVQFLIEKGVDIDTIDLEGRTPLVWASINGYTAIVEALLDEGANPDSRDDDGRTALMRAAWNGHDGVVRQLLDRGAQHGITDAEGKTALDRAREEKFDQVVQVLEGYPRAN